MYVQDGTYLTCSGWTGCTCVDEELGSWPTRGSNRLHLSVKLRAGIAPKSIRLNQHQSPSPLAAAPSRVVCCRGKVGLRERRHPGRETHASHNIIAVRAWCPREIWAATAKYQPFPGRAGGAHRRRCPGAAESLRMAGQTFDSRAKVLLEEEEKGMIAQSNLGPRSWDQILFLDLERD